MRERGRGKLVSRRILDDERQEREGRKDGDAGKLMNLHFLWEGSLVRRKAWIDGKKYTKGGRDERAGVKEVDTRVSEENDGKFVREHLWGPFPPPLSP